MTKNTKQIKDLIKELHEALTEQNGWEPKSARDYGVLCWAAIQEMRDDIKHLRGLDGRIVKLEVAMTIGGLSIIGLAAKLIFGA